MRILPAEWKRITPDLGQWFFGYYDIPSFSKDEKYHLAVKVNFMNRMPGFDDEAEIYAIDLSSGERKLVGKTKAWCFQQSCFAQWIPAKQDTIIYNVRREGGCGYGAIVKNIVTGEEKLIDIIESIEIERARNKKIMEVKFRFDRLLNRLGRV